MGTPFRTTFHDPVNNALQGLAIGATFSPDISDIAILGLATFGLVVSDTYIACPSPTTSFSACPGVTTIWSLK